METTKQTQPWWVWLAEEPEEGSLCVDAENADDARAQYVNANDVELDEGETVETALTAKRVTADEIDKLRDEAEERAGNQHQLRKLIQKAQAVLLRQIVPDGISDHDALTELHGIFDGPECREAMGWKYAAPKKPTI